MSMGKITKFEATKRAVFLNHLQDLGVWFQKFTSKKKCENTGLGGKENLKEFFREGRVGDDKYLVRKSVRGQMGNIPFAIIMKIDIEVIVE